MGSLLLRTYVPVFSERYLGVGRTYARTERRPADRRRAAARRRGRPSGRRVSASPSAPPRTSLGARAPAGLDCAPPTALHLTGTSQDRSTHGSRLSAIAAGAITSLTEVRLRLQPCATGPPQNSETGRPLRSINRRRPTLPGPCGPSTIGAEGLNGSVRKGKRCFPLAIATGNLPRPLPAGPENYTAPMLRISIIRQALDPLVPVSCRRYRPSRSGLSTWWSTRGLTPSRGWENSSRGRLPA